MRVKNFTINVGTQVFRACSDEARIRILYLILQNGEMCISDLEQVLGFTQSKTSRHISYLKNSGLLNIRKSDQWVWYSVKEEMKDIIGLIYKFLEKDNILKNDLNTLQTLFSNRELALNKLSAEEWRKI
ncbi:MAG: metalloregulator ArsR/SmtB family transcription factor [Cyclobacteriaceae bacterium]|nr:metalloregulator ArsR/SmtB family transcription factor [Cyclobacteriaceae bacterium]